MNKKPEPRLARLGLFVRLPRYTAACRRPQRADTTGRISLLPLPRLICDFPAPCPTKPLTWQQISDRADARKLAPLPVFVLR
jgi:hypothetical protein